MQQMKQEWYKSLMIGNWIDATQLGGGYYKITGLGLKSFQVEGFDFGLLYERNYPIDLTPERLEKCGFELDASPQIPEWHHPSGVWFHDKYGTDCYSIRLMGAVDWEFSYLHTLQNYFKIIGEDLEINL